MWTSSTGPATHVKTSSTTTTSLSQSSMHGIPQSGRIALGSGLVSFFDRLSLVDAAKWHTPGYQYCVAGPGFDNPTTSGPSPTTTGPSAPTQTGEPANCNKWYTVQCESSKRIANGTLNDIFLTIQPVIPAQASRTSSSSRLPSS